MTSISLDPERTPELLCALEQTGKRWSRGTHFYHVFGPSDKASAVWILLKFYERAFGQVDSIGIGDAPSDIGFLQLMQRSVIMPSEFSSSMRKVLPEAESPVRPGPLGWSDSIAGFLNATRPRARSTKACASCSCASTYGHESESFSPYSEKYVDERNVEDLHSEHNAAGFPGRSPVFHG